MIGVQKCTWPKLCKKLFCTFLFYAFHGQLARWHKWRACDVGKAMKWLENELWCRWSDGKVGEWPLLYQRRSSLTSYSVSSPTSQLNPQPLFRFSCVTGSSLRSPGEPPMIKTYHTSTYCCLEWQGSNNQVWNTNFLFKINCFFKYNLACPSTHSHVK